MILLGVNIDHVATVREARKTFEPDPVWAAAGEGMLITSSKASTKATSRQVKQDLERSSLLSADLQSMAT